MDQILTQLRAKRDQLDTAIRALEALDRSTLELQRAAKLDHAPCGPTLVRPATAA